MLETEPKFYNLKYDKIFKSVVANPNDTRFLDKMLSDILDEEVKVVEFIPTGLGVRRKSERVKVTDLIVKTNDDKKIIIELNSNYDSAVKIRNLSYFASYYSQYIETGEEYNEEEMEIIQINLNYGKSKKDLFKKTYYLTCVETKEIYTESFKIININVASCKEKWYSECIKGDIKHIYLVMLDADKEEIEELSKRDKVVKEYGEKMYIINKDGSVTRTISEEEDREKIFRTRLHMAENKGLNKGIAKREKETAIKMLQDGVSLELIQKYTSLSEEEIKKLQKKIK